MRKYAQHFLRPKWRNFPSDEAVHLQQTIPRKISCIVEDMLNIQYCSIYADTRLVLYNLLRHIFPLKEAVSRDFLAFFSSSLIQPIWVPDKQSKMV